MKLSEILKEINVLSAAASGDTEITGVCYDSRRVKSGDLFVAVRGYESDGHKYIPMAVEKGCAAVLCEEAPAGNVPYVQTDDSRLGLALAARNFYGDPSREMKVIGITGTNGKTTTTILIKQILEKTLGAKVGLIGSISNMIGDEEFHAEHTTPESCDLQALFRQMADAGCTQCVMEVSSHSLVLRRVAGVHFAVGLFTNLTQDHLDFHNTMEEYAKAKAMLFPMCEKTAANADRNGYEGRAAAGVDLLGEERQRFAHGARYPSRAERRALLRAGRGRARPRKDEPAGTVFRV